MIVSSLGGKDLIYQVMIMLELGVDVIVVMVCICYFIEIGWCNIDNLVWHVWIIEVVLNMMVCVKFNWLGFELVGDISWLEYVAIFLILFWVVVEIGYSFIMYGECL